MIKDYSKVALAIPQLAIDKILFARQMPITFSAGGSQSFGYFTDIPAGDGFAFGSYSLDNGANWTDFGEFAFSSKFTIRPSVTGSLLYNRTNGVVLFSFSGLPGAITILVQVVVVVPSAVAIALNQPIDTSGKIAYRSGGSFQKLFLEFGFQQPGGNTGMTVPVAHNLGYVPQVRVFSDEGTNFIRYTNTVGTEVIKVDENNLTFKLANWTPAAARTLYCRIYRET
jgi:hypothetical protein